jgi:alkanesulfonate monooxygenase SsuD/methylene tetrahydromethanopterin reductase-like flavin-dependent oxidoreductase (luciferase family)
MVNLGVIFHPSYPPEQLIDFAQRAEAGGFDEVWLWEDCFWAGAFTAAAIALGATRHLRVGIGLLPFLMRNPLTFAMELTTLARTYPGRLLPGFGHGVEAWMRQIGASPAPATSSLTALAETVEAVRALLNGERVTRHGSHVHLDGVQMLLTLTHPPPLLIGAMRHKTLHAAGKIGDGSILTDPLDAAYVRWAWEQVRGGMAQAGRTQHYMAVYLLAKIGTDAEGVQAARQSARWALASRLPWALPQLKAAGILEEAQALVARFPDQRQLAPHIPDAWVDLLTACGTPKQVADSVRGLAEAGASTVVLQPMDGDPACLDEYVRHLLPLLKG